MKIKILHQKVKIYFRIADCLFSCNGKIGLFVWGYFQRKYQTSLKTWKESSK